MTRGTALIPLGCGVLFGIGVCVAGMVRPSKIIGALDLGGAWDPSLFFVMTAALSLHLIAWRIVRRATAPRFGSRFPAPASPAIDRRLIAGAAIFGVGWGIAGYCPGPVVVSLVSGVVPPFVFVAAMLAGMYLVRLVDRPRA